MACARRRAVGQTDSRIVRRPMDRPTVRPSGRLLDRVKALVQRVRHVARGVVPRREVEGGVYAAGDLAHPARDQRERAAHRIRPERATEAGDGRQGDRKSTRLNSSHLVISYAVFCLKKKKNSTTATTYH